jgi:hypothetical protein
MGYLAWFAVDSIITALIDREYGLQIADRIIINHVYLCLQEKFWWKLYLVPRASIVQNFERQYTKGCAMTGYHQILIK